MRQPPYHDAQLAKLAALVIRWPDLVNVLTRNRSEALAALEHATGNDDAWSAAIEASGSDELSDRRRKALRAFLDSEPMISPVAHAFL